MHLDIQGYNEADLDSDYGNLYIKEELSAGRVEVCINGNYGPVCSDEEFRGSEAVSVVCSQLGFSRYGQCIHSLQRHNNCSKDVYSYSV